MKSLLVLAGLLALGYAFSKPVFHTRLSFLGLRWVFLSGAEFLLIGWLAGPEGVGLLDTETMPALEPVIHLALGWAGLIFGLQFDLRSLKMYRLRRYVFAFAQACVTMAVATFGAWWALRVAMPWLEPQSLWRAAVVAGVCSGPTASSALHYFADLFAMSGRVLRLLKFVAAVDAVPCVIALGVMACVFHPTEMGGVPEAAIGRTSWFALATALGVLLGLLLKGLVELQWERDELLLFVLGLTALGAGAAHSLGLPAVYTGFLSGVTAANTAWNREEVHKVLAQAEKPLYLGFLLLAGSRMSLADPRIIGLAAVLIMLRALGKVAGNAPWALVGSEPRARSPWLGLGLLTQGPLAVTLAISWLMLPVIPGQDPASSELVISALLLAVLVNEAVSPPLLRMLVPAQVVMPRRRA